jgi:hypothetical protein
MDCPSIDGLNLSAESREGIKRIKNIPELANKLAGTTAGSQVISIFASPTPTLVTIYSIRSTDWLTFSQAMISVPEIARASIVREAQSQWTSAQFRNSFDESRFWQAVANGCKIH